MMRGAVLLFAALVALPARAQSIPIRVVVVETSTTVELRIRMDERIDPGSVEVEIAGRTVTITIHARDVASGERVYERRFILHEPVIEQHATAEYDRTGWLTVALRKQSAARPK